jgi:hypothetical protein
VNPKHSRENLGRKAKAEKNFRDLLANAHQLQKAKAKIDYFATSLPAILLFDDDLQYRQETTALFLQAQAQLGLSKKPDAKNCCPPFCGATRTTRWQRI